MENIEIIAAEGFDPIYGARPLRRAIQSRIEDLLAEKMLENGVGDGDSVTIDEKDGDLTVEIQKAEKASD